MCCNRPVGNASPTTPIQTHSEMPEEIEKMCAAGPPLLKEWGLVFAGKTLAIKDSVAFIAMDKGLNQSSPTEDAIMIVLVALKVVITAVWRLYVRLSGRPSFQVLIADLI